MTVPVLPRRLGLPLAMQMIAILVCVLLAAQFVTLGLTVLLPPSPAARWNMDEVAAALTGGGDDAAIDAGIDERLERKTMSGPPDVAGQGWLVSESSRNALAQRLGRSPDGVVLAFYTQLPVGGVAVPSESRSPLTVELRGGSGLGGLLVDTAQAQSIPGGPPPGGGPGPVGMPGGGFPGGRPPGASPTGGFPGGRPPGTIPGGGPGQMPGNTMPGNTMPGNTMPGTNMPRPGGPPTTGNPGGGPVRPPSAPGQAPGTQIPATPVGGPVIGGPGMGGPIMGGPSTGVPGALAPNIPVASGPAALPAPRSRASSQPVAPRAIATRPATTANPYPLPLPSATGTARAAAAQEPVAQATGSTGRAAKADAGAPTATPQPIPFRRVRDSLFAVASPPFIEGDFVAAARQPDGRWLAVAPRAEPFPNAWQKRVMLWFALSLAIVSPLAWLFARRIVLPLRDFAKAAEQLGRDPSATILPLSGPAEIGRAANAFNQMRFRLRAFVDDRTAMVGAISHDLRTPLTRLRFRIEDVPDDQREGLLKEVSEMEAMISQVIAFIRDASTPGPRERVDFAELIAGSVADARLVGADVEIERNAHIPVEVDPVGIRRLLGNLLENAVKYGEGAKVRVSLRDGEAVAEIIDRGPGIPEDEFDRAFEPFYRGDSARESGQSGSGLGLAVCRSIARAHGGDVSFTHGRDGFAARVSVPAALSPTLRRAA